MKRRKNVKEIILSMPFFAVLFYMAVISFLLPLRPEISVLEKRRLEPFPEFSFSSLASGDYFSKMSLWFADTFPARDTWMEINNGVESLHGFTSNYIDISQYGKNEEIPEADQPAAVTPQITPSAAAEAEAAPAVEEKVPFSMKDQKTEFTEIDPNKIDIEVYGASAKIGDTIYACYGFSQEASQQYVSYINSFADRCKEKGMNLYNLPAPTSDGIILSAEMRKKIHDADQDKVLEYLDSLYNENVHGVNSYSILKEHSNEYLYYHTDHHWTGLGAYYAYLAFCESAGLNPVSLDEYTELDQGEFLGSFAAVAAQSRKIKMDTVTAYYPPGDIYLMRPNSRGDLARYDVITDESSSEIYDKFNCYIGGDHRLEILVNEDLGDDAPSCLLIKDSFGNPFSIYLTQHYRNVVVIDYRKLGTVSAMDFAETYGVDDIIICQCIGVSQSINANGLLGQVLS